MKSSVSSSSLPSPRCFSSILMSSVSKSCQSRCSFIADFMSIVVYSWRLSLSSTQNDNVEVLSESLSDKELCQSSTMFLLIFQETPERNKWWKRITDHIASVFEERMGKKNLINERKRLTDSDLNYVQNRPNEEEP